MKNLIEVQNLKKHFTTKAGELQVLKGVDLSIKEREMVGIVGASGVGKSTLLHILGALDSPTSGKVFYNGNDIFLLDEHSLAYFRNKSIGFVFQFHHLLPEFTALENVMMPGLISMGSSVQGFKGLSYKEVKERAERLLNELGLSERESHRPGELSGGEQQRVAVARALILEPNVVLADEPTGNLDTTTGEELFNLLVNLNKEKGITFVIVTHNESLSKRCHRIFKMVNGRVVD
ncbi:MAG: ABC transporter ATP-binding protein [Nitrospirota bacterium]|nr:ABC transporter ATP-binding protein [Nitrospirota bacterium]MDH5767752.1 ABC transporter ATP-binding protein [Nitrospirota bacterium]